MEKKYKIAYSISQNHDVLERLPMERVGSDGRGEYLQVTITMMVCHKYRVQLTSPVCVQSQHRSGELVREGESSERVGHDGT